MLIFQIKPFERDRVKWAVVHYFVKDTYYLSKFRINGAWNWFAINYIELACDNRIHKTSLLSFKLVLLNHELFPRLFTTLTES